jgi:hypothetical protein
MALYTTGLGYYANDLQVWLMLKEQQMKAESICTAPEMSPRFGNMRWHSRL